MAEGERGYRPNPEHDTGSAAEGTFQHRFNTIREILKFPDQQKLAEVFGEIAKVAEVQDALDKIYNAAKKGGSYERGLIKEDVDHIETLAQDAKNGQDVHRGVNYWLVGAKGLLAEFAKGEKRPWVKMVKLSDDTEEHPRTECSHCNALGMAGAVRCGYDGELVADFNDEWLKQVWGDELYQEAKRLDEE